MQRELLLNIIPFNPPVGKQTFAFYKQKHEGYFPVFKDDLQGLLEENFISLELLELPKLCTDFQPEIEGAIELDIDLSVSTSFTNNYYRYLIRNYFGGIADTMHEKFTTN